MSVFLASRLQQSLFDPLWPWLFSLAFVAFCVLAFLRWRWSSLKRRPTSLSPLPDPMYLAFLRGGFPEILRFAVYRLLCFKLFRKKENKGTPSSPVFLALKKRLSSEEEQIIETLSSLERELVKAAQEPLALSSLEKEPTLKKRAQEEFLLHQKSAIQQGHLIKSPERVFYYTTLLFFVLSFFGGCILLASRSSHEEWSFLFSLGGAILFGGSLLLVLTGFLLGSLVGKYGRFFRPFGRLWGLPRLTGRGKRYLAELRLLCEKRGDGAEILRTSRENRLFSYALLGSMAFFGEYSGLVSLILPEHRLPPEKESCGGSAVWDSSASDLVMWSSEPSSDGGESRGGDGGGGCGSDGGGGCGGGGD